MNEQRPKTVEEFFQGLPEKLDPDAAEGLDAVYQFDLSGNQGGQYYMLIREGSCRVTRGSLIRMSRCRFQRRTVSVCSMDN